ncbi:GMC family oxidoreductase [Pseudomonas aeruginosa]|uniref:GMC family oxidoreductase n=1 Tax=Pseudomonas aeruginosa TaxID=287 RepID=UPI000EB38522|nr:choline dehydrogenase [Pseudomonas aeruginosa]HCT7101482.1 choline dehydrogenase [Pseudomonas aeruginosa]HEN8507903.1 choline dehydrogenase [Pseudomonas aeruginosa]HEN8756326.1 choline dehydrogenase [Pseudomonas aeruginosa]HEN8806097.1 choline dehydrogenase [Pseudomonas aeruginosa]
MASSFDYVIVGGGSAGAALAGRLSEDPSITVCVIEAGGRGDGAVVNLPVGAVTMLPTRLNNWAFHTVPQKGLNGRRGYQPRGKVLGGGSAINAMLYIRGHRRDYDEWAGLGCPGWSYSEVLPYFIRSERNTRLGGPWHGQEGPLWVSDIQSDMAYQQRFLDAARQAGFPTTDDFNGAQQEGLGIYQVTQQNGERCSAARAYLLPHLETRSNLFVETHAMVSRVLIDGDCATGVEFERGGQLHRISARAEVILSAGALQSPQLLMLSGVGPREELERWGIGVVQDSPGVGVNLQDHPDFTFAYRARGTDGFGISAVGALKMIPQVWRYLRRRRGMLASNFVECGGFLKTRDDLEVPDIQLHFAPAIVMDHARKLATGHGLSCHVCLLRPKSRGTVKLASADFRQPPLIDPAFLEDPDDLDTMVTGYKTTRRLLQAPALASWIDRNLITPHVQSDEDIRAMLRSRVDTVYHPVGTCRMGTDADAVVDPQLRVHGVRGLRVVDASIMPTLIGGNTNAPSIMIAEKAADMIRGRPALPPIHICEPAIETSNAAMTARDLIEAT